MSYENKFYQHKELLNCIETLANISRKKLKCIHEETQEHNMEHSYSRDWRPADNSQSSSTRSLMVHRPPQCPSCHIHSHDEGIDLDDPYNPPIPSYNEEAAKKDMQKSENSVIRNMKNSNPEDLDWEERVNKAGWTTQQNKLFVKVAGILDMDRLARLTLEGKPHEPVHRRVVIDKSVSRMRQALAAVSWDTRISQWLHGLMMDYLPPSYLTAYVDILQTLKAKLPQLVDKMVFGRPTSSLSQEILGPMLKEPWDPIVAQKNRKLPNQPIIVVVPSGPSFSSANPRMQKWYALFATMSSVVPISVPTGGSGITKQTITVVTEQMVQITRAKIQEIRNEAPTRPIILLGFNAGASLAIQVGLVENANCIIALGFSYNTVNGTRGAPDDHLMDITTPILFVIGQNAARSSQEEIESLRERMAAQTSLVVVGSADDCLRVSKTKRKIEGVTQQMVDNMIADEIAEFATNCLLNPSKLKQTLKDPINQKSVVISPNSRKRRISQNSDTETMMKIPRATRPLTFSKNLLIQTSMDTDKAVESILQDSQIEYLDEVIIKKEAPKIITSYQITSDNAPKMEIRQSAQFVSGIASSPIVLPMIKREGQNAANTNTTSLKIGQGNSFIQLKPVSQTINPMQSQKVYTIKGMPSQTQNKQIITLPSKGTTQRIITTTSRAKLPLQQQAMTSSSGFSPQKFTIVRGASIAKEQPDKQKMDEFSNILDMPIVFADSDGILQDSPTVMPSNKIITIPKQMNKVTSYQIIDRSDPKFKQIQANLLQGKPGQSIKIISSSATTTKQSYMPAYTPASSSQHATQIVRQVLRLGDTQIKPTSSASNTIMIKTSDGGKMKPTILNRNLTVRKITNPSSHQLPKNK